MFTIPIQNEYFNVGGHILEYTDSIPLTAQLKKLKIIRQLTLSGMLSEAIRRVSNEESISAMFENEK